MNIMNTVLKKLELPKNNVKISNFGSSNKSVEKKNIYLLIPKIIPII